MFTAIFQNNTLDIDIIQDLIFSRQGDRAVHAQEEKGQAQVHPPDGHGPARGQGRHFVNMRVKERAEDL